MRGIQIVTILAGISQSCYGGTTQYTNAFARRKLPFNFEFEDFYSGRRQDMEDAMAMESVQQPVYALPDQFAESRSSSEPVYFITEDPDSLHADRSAYSFEPADSHSTVPQQAVIAASNEDFVIKEHTYQMCPGCPSFSIPIPVPKESSDTNEVINPFNSDPGYEFQHPKEQTIMERIMAVVQPAIDNAREAVNGFFDTGKNENEVAGEGFADRLSSVEVADKSDSSPLVYAGMAAMGLGVAALLSSGLQIMAMDGVTVGRDFNAVGYSDNGDAIDSDVSEFNINDIRCIPRTFCEKLKNQKNFIDEYPTAKKIASFMAGMVFDQSSVSESISMSALNQCHLKDCVFDLLK